MISINKKHFSFIVTLLITVVSGSCLNAGWSTPQEEISSSTDYSYAPSIATDSNGNSIAVWYEGIDFNANLATLKAATLASGAVNGSGAPLWVAVGDVTTDAQIQEELVIQSVGVDANGNAIAAWTDSNVTNIYVSRLPYGHSTWSPLLQINTPQIGEIVRAPYIAVNPRGDAIVTWAGYILAEPSYAYNMWSNAYNSQTGVWQGQVNMWESMNELNSYTNAVAIDPNGNGVAVISEGDSNTFQAYSYLLLTNTWTPTNSLPMSGDQLNIDVAVDPAGNATIIVEDEAVQTVTAYTLPFNQHTLTNQTTLSTTTPMFHLTLPQVKTDLLGNALAVWSDESEALASARYSPITKKWTALPLLPQSIVGPITLAMDARGNAVATWSPDGTVGFLSPLVSPIQSAFLPANGTIWQGPIQVSSDSNVENSFPKVVLTSVGDAVVIWTAGSFINLMGMAPAPSTTISSSIYLGLFPTPPLDFRGKVIKNKFLSQTTYINHLTWNASRSTSIVSYNLYRNGQKIANFQNNAPSFTYNDRGLKPTGYIYTLTSVSSYGTESGPVTVTLR